MKFSYSPITFTSNPAENTALLQNRDYHTLCVVQDCFGTINGTALAGLAARGETFTVNPAWDCGRGEAWFRAQSAREFPAGPATTSHCPGT